MADRVIFHCDCNSFFASVEETFHPELKQVPMAVAGDPENRRGIILAKNELAKKYNIKTAETIWAAKQKCPDLVFCPPRRQTYSAFCERVNAIYEQYTDQVERFGIDESYLDVTGSLHLFGGDALGLAHQIRKRVAAEIGLTISVGVSWNKIFAKLGSDYQKPNAVTHITHENVHKIVHPLPVSDLFLVGKNTNLALQKFGITTIGQLAACEEAFLRRQFGKLGEQLYLYANGLDSSPVARVGVHDPLKSVGNGITFKRDLLTQQDIKTGVIALADSVAARLRHADMKCATVQVTIKDTNLKAIQRQKPAPQQTYLAAEIAQTALEIIATAWSPGKPIRMLTITAQQLSPAEQTAEQLSLFGTSGSQKKESIEKTMDEIRSKFGSRSILHGAVLENDLGID